MSGIFFENTLSASFADETVSEEFETVIKRAQTDGCEKFIFDVRNNALIVPRLVFGGHHDQFLRVKLPRWRIVIAGDDRRPVIRRLFADEQSCACHKE